MRLNLVLFYKFVLILNTVQGNKKTFTTSEETSLCNQLLYDVYNLREDSAILSKKLNNQVNVVHDNLAQIRDMFNVTSKNQNHLITSQSATSHTLELLLTTVSAVNAKLEQFDEKLQRLDALDAKLNSHAVELENQMNEKFRQDRDQFDNINRELNKIKDLTGSFQTIAKKSYLKLPKTVPLGLTSANLTNS